MKREESYLSLTSKSTLPPSKNLHSETLHTCTEQLWPALEALSLTKNMLFASLLYLRTFELL